MVLMPGTEVNEVCRIAENIRATIEQAQIEHGYSNIDGGVVTVSAGAAAIVPTRTMDSSQLVKKCDEALYAAKNAGRNRVNLAGA